MTITALSPLSPRACSNLATSLLDGSEPTNSLWSFRGPGSSPSPTLVCDFDTVDDLLGTTITGVRGIALVTQSRIDGSDGWTALVQSTCGCGAVALRAGDATVRSVAGASFDGYLNDLTRRLLGLDTAPEFTPPIESFNGCWLSDVLDAAADPVGARLVRTWSGVLSLHPLLGPFADRVASFEPDYISDVVAELTAGVGWEDLRDAIAQGAQSCAGLQPAEAEWMDAGMFARWTLGCHRDVDQLLEDCSLFLELNIFERLQCAVTGSPY